MLNKYLLFQLVLMTIRISLWQVECSSHIKESSLSDRVLNGGLYFTVGTEHTCLVSLCNEYWVMTVIRTKLCPVVYFSDDIDTKCEWESEWVSEWERQSVCVCVCACVCACVCSLRSRISLSSTESTRTGELLHATPTFRVTDPDYVCSVGEKPKLLLT